MRHSTDPFDDLFVYRPMIVARAHFVNKKYQFGSVRNENQGNCATNSHVKRLLKFRFLEFTLSMACSKSKIVDNCFFLSLHPEKRTTERYVRQTTIAHVPNAFPLDACDDVRAQ